MCVYVVCSLLHILGCGWRVAWNLHLDGSGLQGCVQQSNWRCTWHSHTKKVNIIAAYQPCEPTREGILQSCRCTHLLWWCMHALREMRSRQLVEA